MTDDKQLIIDDKTTEDRDPQEWRVRLKSEMKRRDMSFQDLADLIGCSRQQVSKMLQGRGKIFQPFLLQAAKAMNLSYRWLLGGIPSGDVHCPLLDDWQIARWLQQRPAVTEGITCPALLEPGPRTFVWIQPTDELDDGAGGWREGDYLFIDPDRQILANKSPVVFAQLDKGWIVRKLRVIAGEQWLVPGNRIYNSVPVADGVVALVGIIIGGLRCGDYHL